MIRKVLFLILVFASFLNVNGQTRTILDVNNSRTVNLVVDFSQASIHNLTEEEFKTYEPDYERLKPEVVAKLADKFNQSDAVQFMLGNFPKSEYTLKVNVIHVNVKGTITSFAEVLNSDGTVLATLPEMKGNGGTFGSKMNLIGDGCKSTGKLLAKNMKSCIKKALKEAKKHRK